MGSKIKIGWAIAIFLISGCDANSIFNSPSFDGEKNTSVTQNNKPTVSASTSPTPSASPVSTPSPSPSPSASPAPSPSPSSSSSPASGNTASAASYFPSDLYFNQSIASAPLDSQSATIISTLAANGGWGNGDILQIDFSISVYYANSGSTILLFQNNGMTMPDSDVPASIPVPPSGGTQGFESGEGRTCDGGDCHYLVMDLPNNQLTEVWHADGVTGSEFGSNGSLAIWPFSKTWLSNFRGDTCTSADAGGLMIAPMLFTGGELSAGQINHAIRLILPNSRIASKTYVRPATHMTGSSSGWANPETGVPYGARFRLKSTFDVSSLSAGAQVVARALQTYGMILADGGNIAFTAGSDAAAFIGSKDLSSLQVSDFDMVQNTDGGVRYQPSGFTCVRNP
jgi:hypothetical protein